MESLLIPQQADPSPNNVCLEKSNTLFLSADWFQSFLHKSADPTGECHTTHMTLPQPAPIQEHNPVQFMDRLKPTLDKNEKYKQ
jgi:hypothetical protein